MALREIDTGGNKMISPETRNADIVNTGGGPVLTPRDSADLADLVRHAAAAGTTLRIRGAGTWLDAGNPVNAATTVDLASLSGIVEYVPGDLTLTAGAATPLSAIAAATAPHRQWLALDPFGSDLGTLGATVATASAGPLASSIGLSRDLALGLELITGSGDCVRAGGRVVKNVAGYDLVRLNIGAWGTLGVLTQIRLRLRGIPECDETVALSSHSTTDLGARWRALRLSALSPLALEELNNSAARAVGLLGACTLVRVSGNEDQVAGQLALLQSLGTVANVSTNVWHKLRQLEPAGSTTIRLPSYPL